MIGGGVGAGDGSGFVVPEFRSSHPPVNAPGYTHVYRRTMHRCESGFFLVSVYLSLFSPCPRICGLMVRERKAVPDELVPVSLETSIPEVIL